jgi:heme/copper-type cytochrome/quinol oxidase subunit 1
MTRAGVITAHLGALPAAVLLSVLLALVIPSHRATDVQLHDTFFVVAHFHSTILLGTCVLVATLVTYRYGTINPLIIAAWAFFVIHVACAAIPWPGRGSVSAPGPGVVVTVLPSNWGWGYLSVVSAVAGFLAVFLGIVVSLSRDVWREGRR